MPGDHQVFKTGQFSKSVDHFCDTVREYASFRAIWRRTQQWGLFRSDTSAGTTGQSSEGPCNGGIARLETGKEEKARSEDSRRKVRCDN